MKQLRRTALAGMVWTTAVMSLIAGIPHCVCQCPDGHVKPFCVGAELCCDAVQPTSDLESDEQTPCCCAAGSDQTAPATDSSTCSAQSSSCTRTLAQLEDATLEQVKVSRCEEKASALDLPVPAHLALLACHSAQGSNWQVHPPAPPGDVIILLQHFLI